VLTQEMTMMLFISKMSGNLIAAKAFTAKFGFDQAPK
jgi:hypothetical protein